MNAKTQTQPATQPAAHTPTPWHINESKSVMSASGLHLFTVNGYGTKDETDFANAALIIRAVNSHAELVAAAQNAANVLAALATGDLKELSINSAALKQLRAALAKAQA